MKKVAVGVLVLVALVVAAMFVFNRPSFDPAAYEPLLTPAISTKAAQKVVEVTMRGEPSKISGPAIGLLFQAFRAVKSEHEGVEWAAPRARWPADGVTPVSEWVGHFALPIPDTVEALPKDFSTADAQVKINTWEYGEVAEILHIGAYDAEKPSIDKLKAFIAEQSYETSGDHEEEYVKGPGWFFAGDPSEYYTVIRYPVRKVAGVQAQVIDEGGDKADEEVAVPQ